MLPRIKDKWPEWSAADHTEWLHKLGNLFLVPPSLNALLGNKSFADKLRVLHASSYFVGLLGEELALGRTVWDATVVAARQRRLLRIAQQIWPTVIAPASAITISPPPTANGVTVVGVTATVSNSTSAASIINLSNGTSATSGSNLNNDSVTSAAIHDVAISSNCYTQMERSSSATAVLHFDSNCASPMTEHRLSFLLDAKQPLMPCARCCNIAELARTLKCLPANIQLSNITIPWLPPKSRYSPKPLAADDQNWQLAFLDNRLTDNGLQRSSLHPESASLFEILAYEYNRLPPCTDESAVQMQTVIANELSRNSAVYEQCVDGPFNEYVQLVNSVNYRGDLLCLAAFVRRHGIRVRLISSSPDDPSAGFWIEPANNCASVTITIACWANDRFNSVIETADELGESKILDNDDDAQIAKRARVDPAIVRGTTRPSAANENDDNDSQNVQSQNSAIAKVIKLGSMTAIGASGKTTKTEGRYFTVLYPVGYVFERKSRGFAFRCSIVYDSSLRFVIEQLAPDGNVIDGSMVSAESPSAGTVLALVKAAPDKYALRAEGEKKRPRVSGPEFFGLVEMREQIMQLEGASAVYERLQPTLATQQLLSIPSVVVGQKRPRSPIVAPTAAVTNNSVPTQQTRSIESLPTGTTSVVPVNDDDDDDGDDVVIINSSSRNHSLQAQFSKANGQLSRDLIEQVPFFFLFTYFRCICFTENTEISTTANIHYLL